jgi:hypothetical protein
MPHLSAMAARRAIPRAGCRPRDSGPSTASTRREEGQVLVLGQDLVAQLELRAGGAAGGRSVANWATQAPCVAMDTLGEPHLVLVEQRLVHDGGDVQQGVAHAHQHTRELAVGRHGNQSGEQVFRVRFL